MAIKNVAIKGINGLPLADMQAREEIKKLSMSNPQSPTTPIENPFKGKAWAVFGDSISQPNTDGVDKYYNYIARDFGMTVTSYAVGGSGYFKGSSVVGYGANNIIDRLTNAPTNFDVISFMAGVNESSKAMGNPADATPVGEPATLCGAVRKTFELAIEKYPNAQIFLICPTPGTGNNATPTQGSLNTYVENQIKIARMYNIPVIDLYHESNLRPWNATNASKYYRDYCHLLTEGHAYIAKLIEEFMMNKLVV